MKKEIIGIFMVASLMAWDVGQPQAPSDASQVETVVREYFEHLANYDYLAMREMATPEYETLDGGVRLSHPEFEDYVRGTAQLNGNEMVFHLSQFDTQIYSDIAYTTFHNTISLENSPAVTRNLDGMILKRSGDQWLVDRFFHMRVAGNPPQIVRQIYHYIKAFNYDGIRMMTTPGFEITVNGRQMDNDAFEAQLREAAAQRYDTAEARQARLVYELVDFEIDETDEVAHVRCLETRPDGVNYLNELTLVSSDGRWLVDRFSHDRLD